MPRISSSGEHQATTPPSGDEFTRLHISPLDVDLLKVIIPASALPRARDISYHTIETFPERRYGFINLPRDDADKLRAKLNGAVLKGAKIRIEKARPETRPEHVTAEDESKIDTGSALDGSKKRKRDNKVIAGVALTDRKVKRGWTETPTEMTQRKRKERSEKGAKKESKKDEKEKKKRTKSKYTEQEECLLKTKVPANATKNIPAGDASHKKKKKKSNSSSEVTVHEFERTTKFPTFLKDAATGPAHAAATEFVEGKGWVDEDGNVVQTVTAKRPKPSVKKEPKKPITPAAMSEDDDDTSSSGTSSEDPESDSDPSSSDSNDDDTQNPTEHTTAAPAVKTSATETSSPPSAHLRIDIPPNTLSNDAVHPLEALYKRQPPGAVTETPAKSQPFSFFGGDADDEDGEEEKTTQTDVPMPMTPFTRQDYEWRNVRSAAPTPDTTHPSRMKDMWLSQQDLEDAEEDDLDDEEMADGDNATNGEASNSDFQSWFWQNRRELNQSWMKRRRTAAKEKRHRENKARASRAV